jgi:hypothetical protein
MTGAGLRAVREAFRRAVRDLVEQCQARSAGLIRQLEEVPV